MKAYAQGNSTYYGCDACLDIHRYSNVYLFWNRNVFLQQNNNLQASKQQHSSIRQSPTHNNFHKSTVT